jgi:hypothetical protein
MITWAAMLLLRGVEDGMTHQDGMERVHSLTLQTEFLTYMSYLDLGIIQTHLSSLKRSDLSVPSIHGVLADRLQSGMQSMHTPPDMGPELSFPPPNMDYSWTIFDQEIMSLANPPWLFEGPSIGSTQTQVELSQASAMQPARYTDGMTAASGSGFGSNKQWGPTEQLANVRPSRFGPGFGHGNVGNDGYIL